MLCYAILCYAMLGYAMVCDAMLSDAKCYAMLCYAMLCYAMLCYVMLGLGLRLRLLLLALQLLLLVLTDGVTQRVILRQLLVRQPRVRDGRRVVRPQPLLDRGVLVALAVCRRDRVGHDFRSDRTYERRWDIVLHDSEQGDAGGRDETLISPARLVNQGRNPPAALCWEWGKKSSSQVRRFIVR